MKIARKRFLPIFMLLAILVPLAFSLYTANIWEDFLITFKFSKNLCEGNGLVYAPGEKVHGFTSPLGTLLPAICCYFSKGGDHVTAIWLFRIFFCIPAFAMCAYLLFRMFDSGKELVSSACIAVALLFLVEPKSVAFSVNGMETAMMLCFLAWALLVIKGGIQTSWLQLGIAWAGMMWTRPDSSIYIACMMISAFLFRGEHCYKDVFKAIIKASLVTTVLYLPWFIWAFCYYGSPVPQTVQAKSAVFSYISIMDYLHASVNNIWPLMQLIFGPMYPAEGDWPPVMMIASALLCLYAITYWLNPYLSRNDSFGRKISFITFLLFFYYVFMLMYFPWYYPPVAMLSIIVVGCSIANMRTEPAYPLLRKLGGYAYGLLFLVLLAELLMTACQLRLMQKISEEGTRQKVGEWLALNVKKDERVYLECLGYIGYFSGAKMLDFPGLVAPEVSNLLRTGKYSFTTIPLELKSEWIVLRPGEYENFSRIDYFNRNYEEAQVFYSLDEIDKYKYIPGRKLLIANSCFFIYHRKK